MKYSNLEGDPGVTVQDDDGGNAAEEYGVARSSLVSPLMGPSDSAEMGGVVGERNGAKNGGGLSYPSAMFVTVAVFSGYAALVIYQHNLSGAMNLGKDNCDAAAKEKYAQFKHATSLNYVGNLIFRIAHNFVLAPLRPSQRVYFSLFSMMCSMSILGFGIVIGGLRSLAWVFLAYFLGGVAVGTFESNLLSVISPLGPATKVWAIIGMPVGFNLISIGGEAFLAIAKSAKFESEDSLAAIYVFVVVMCVLGAIVFSFRIPKRPVKGNSLTFAEFKANMAEWRNWFPQIRRCALALFFDMFCVSFFSGIMFYILNDRNYVPLFGKLDGEKTLVSHDWFFAVYNLSTFLGDTISRKIVYRIKPRNPLFFLIFSAVGAAMCLCRIPILAPLGAFLIFFGNGAVYGSTTRLIDSTVDPKYNLIALSVWLFLGDIGSVSGSNIWQAVQKVFCGDVKAVHMCVVSNSTCAPTHAPTFAPSALSSASSMLRMMR